MPLVPEPQPWYSTREVAALFDVRTATVALWIRQERLPAISGATGRYRVKHDDLVKFAAEYHGIELPPLNEEEEEDAHADVG